MSPQKHIITLFMLAIFNLADTNGSFASVTDNQQRTGEQVMKELEARDTGWGSATVELSMTLKNARGDESKRLLNVKFLEVEQDGDKTLTLFKAPKDIRNAAFLSYSHAIEPDDQWIYMPSFRRVKRISSANKSGPFMGSELAYEDISSFELAKYDYTYLSQESYQGIDCFIVALVPRYEYSGYSKIQYWVDKERYIPLKIEYFDRSQALLKTQVFSEYQQYKDQYWRPVHAQIDNHQTKRTTLLNWGSFDFDTKLGETDFSRISLTRNR